MESMVVWTVYLGVFIDYKYPEPALTPSCPALSIPPAPPTPVLLLLVLSRRMSLPPRPANPCPADGSRRPGGSLGCSGRPGGQLFRNGRPWGGYGGGVVRRSRSVRAATERSRNKKIYTQNIVIHLFHTFGDLSDRAALPRLPIPPHRHRIDAQMHLLSRQG